MITSYSSSIVIMISTKSSDVTPSSDNADSRVIADGSNWACLAIIPLSTSSIFSPMVSHHCCLCWPGGHQHLPIYPRSVEPQAVDRGASASDSPLTQRVAPLGIRHTQHQPGR